MNYGIMEFCPEEVRTSYIKPWIVYTKYCVNVPFEVHASEKLLDYYESLDDEECRMSKDISL